MAERIRPGATQAPIDVFTVGDAASAEVRRKRSYHPIMTARQEKILFTNLRKGEVGITSITDNPEFLADIPDDEKKRKNWAYIFKTNDTLRDTAAALNHRMVVSLASRYGKLIEFPDAIAAGDEGLLRAIDKFDPEKDRFSTYAKWWIRDAIQIAICEQYGISKQTYAELGKVKDIRDAFLALYQAEPTQTELEAQLWTNTSLTPNQIAMIKAMPSAIELLTTPFDKRVDDEGDIVFFEPVDTTIPSMEDHIEGLSIKVAISTSLANQLNKRDRAVVEAYMGLYGEKTLVQIAQEHNISEQRVAQLLTRAFTKLRNDPTLVTSGAGEGRTGKPTHVSRGNGKRRVPDQLSREQIQTKREAYRSEKTEMVKAYLQAHEKDSERSFASARPAKGRKPATKTLDNLVMELVGQGLSYSQMAQTIGTTVDQVDNSLRRLRALGKISV